MADSFRSTMADINEMIEEANRLIESVYSMDASTSTPRSRARDDYSDAEFLTASPKTPPTTSRQLSSPSPNRSRLLLLSPSPSRSQSESFSNDLAMEIKRINNYCDSVDRDLRSIGMRQSFLSLNSSASEDNINSSSILNNTATSPVNTELSPPLTTTASAPQPSISTTTLPAPASPQLATRQTSTTRRRSRRVSSNAHENGTVNSNTGPEDFIDLSNSTQMAEPILTANPNENTPNNGGDNADDDDDVICIYSDLDNIVDLCTPTQETTRSRIAGNPRNHIRRRQLHQQRSSHSRSPLTTTNAPQLPATKQKDNSKSQQQKSQKQEQQPSWTTSGNLSTSITSDNNERVPLMCAVCMESSLNNAPTSTKCGHVFCNQCINKAIRLTHKCPMCNTKLTNRMLVRIYV